MLYINRSAISPFLQEPLSGIRQVADAGGGGCLARVTIHFIFLKLQPDMKGFNERTSG